MPVNARDQVTRLLALVPYLQARPDGVALDAAAAEFGVPPATIVADLKVLWFCGLPGLGPGDLIDIDMDALEDDGDGVIRISNADYLRRPLRLGSSEASALVVALRAMREGSPEGSREAIDRALAKLEAAATDGADILAAEVIDVPSYDARTGPLRADLERAVATGRQVRLDYFVPSRDENTERVVDPLAVLEADGRVYLDAWCHLAEARRLFRLDRVNGLTVLDEPALDHEVAARDLSAGMFEAGPQDQVATIRLRPPARWVAEYYSVEEQTELPGGALEVRMRAGDPLWLVRLVLRLAPYAELVGPVELQDLVGRHARSALAAYAD